MSLIFFFFFGPASQLSTTELCKAFLRKKYSYIRKYSSPVSNEMSLDCFLVTTAPQKIMVLGMLLSTVEFANVPKTDNLTLFFLAEVLLAQVEAQF